ncbi:Ribosomal biogenesis protein las1l [Gonapodya sp. JEL0774]|nr:Ribosomal biogenesis protein las1l [Gonapodya sp. JEL0774]
MGRLRVVPWKNAHEWERLYSSLYALVKTEPWDDMALEFAQWGVEKTAVSKAKAWRSRGTLPPAIDSTASFVEVALRDPHFVRNGTFEQELSEHELRILYSMVFVRFVNGLVATVQQGQYAASVVSLARQLGLPAWFVDLRHAATHERMPGITALRNGCSQALAWLDSNYWSVQSAYLINPASSMRTLVLRYRTVRAGIIALRSTDKESNYADAEPAINPHSEMARALSEVADLISSHDGLSLFIDALMDPSIGFASVPAELLDTEKLSTPLPPAIVSKLWLPLVRSLSDSVSDFAQCLLERLADAIALSEWPVSTTDLEVVSSSVWDSTMFSAYKSCLFNFATLLLRDAALRPLLDYGRLLAHCLRLSRAANGSGLSAAFAREVVMLCDPGTAKSAAEKMLGIIGAEWESGSDTTMSVLEEVQLEELEVRLNSRVETQESTVESLPSDSPPLDSPWFTFPAKVWKPAPIGNPVSVDPAWWHLERPNENHLVDSSGLSMEAGGQSAGVKRTIDKKAVLVREGKTRPNMSSGTVGLF